MSHVWPRSFVHQLRLAHDELLRITWRVQRIADANRDPSETAAVLQAVNFSAWNRPLLRVNRITPQVLGCDHCNFLNEGVSLAVCIRESTTDKPGKRFIDKTNDVNTKADHAGDSMPRLLQHPHFSFLPSGKTFSCG